MSTGRAGATLALLGAILLLSPISLPAQDATLAERTRAVASQLRCPVCRGVSIAASPAKLAREMKAVVRRQLAAGRSPEQVKQYFVSKYGEWILLAPEPEGFNLTVYLLPLLALLAGALVVAIAVRRWTRSPAPERDRQGSRPV